jgi:hypothetical protein
MSQRSVNMVFLEKVVSLGKQSAKVYATARHTLIYSPVYCYIQQAIDVAYVVLANCCGFTQYVKKTLHLLGFRFLVSGLAFRFAPPNLKPETRNN